MRSLPEMFLPLWTKFAKSISGHQMHTVCLTLGNNGNGISHEIWASFNSSQDLKFLSGMYGSKEFALPLKQISTLNLKDHIWKLV